MDGFRDMKLIGIKEVKEWNDNKKLFRTTNELDGKRKWEKQQSEIAEQEASLLSCCCCLNLMSQFTWSVSLSGLQGFFKVPVFGQGNQKQKINILILYPIFFFMNRTEPDLLSTHLLFLTLSTPEPQEAGRALMGDVAQAHLYPAPKFPSSPEALPRFPTSPTEQTDKFSTFIPLSPSFHCQGEAVRS